jgi:hypothetical protein
MLGNSANTWPIDSFLYAQSTKRRRKAREAEKGMLNDQKKMEQVAILKKREEHGARAAHEYLFHGSPILRPLMLKGRIVHFQRLHTSTTTAIKEDRLSASHSTNDNFTGGSQSAECGTPSRG